MAAPATVRLPARIAFHAAGTVLVLTFLAHTAAHLAGQTPPSTDQERQLLDLMKSYTLPDIGRTTMELFSGFGLHFSLSLLCFAALGWVLLPWAKRDSCLFRALSGILALTMLAFTTNSVIHFFLIPTAFQGLAALLFIAAFALAPRSIAQEPAL